MLKSIISDYLANMSRSDLKTKTKVNGRRFTFLIPDKHEEAFWILYQMEKMYGKQVNDELCHMIIDHFSQKGGLPAIPRLHEYYRCKRKTVGEMHTHGEITDQELADIYKGLDEIFAEILDSPTLFEVVKRRILDKKQT